MCSGWLARGVFCVLFGLGVAGSTPAAAHPHVFVDTVTSFVIAQGNVTAIRLHWRFDPFFSAALLQDFHKGSGKVLSAQEIQAIEDGAFRATAEQGYFTHLKLDGQALTGLTPKGFTARIEGEQMIYEFLLPLPAPIDPRARKLTITYYEKSYYVDVMPTEENPVKFEGDGSLKCKSSISEDQSITIFYGVHPAMVDLSC